MTTTHNNVVALPPAPLSGPHWHFIEQLIGASCHGVEKPCGGEGAGDRRRGLGAVAGVVVAEHQVHWGRLAAVGAGMVLLPLRWRRGDWGGYVAA